MNPQTIQTEMAKRGLNIKRWAEANGFPASDVYNFLRECAGQERTEKITAALQRDGIPTAQTQPRRDDSNDFLKKRPCSPGSKKS